MNHKRTLKVRLEEAAKIESNLLSKLLGSLNPFSQYLISEIISGEDGKVWELDEAMFQGQTIRKENLVKSTSEMFVIYKYTNDPKMVVKSAKYTDGLFTECRNLLPVEEELLFETSILKHLKC